MSEPRSAGPDATIIVDAPPGLRSAFAALRRGFVPADIRHMGEPVVEIVHDPEAAALLLAIHAVGHLADTERRP